MTADEFDLERFVRAQDAGGTFDRAVGELAGGRKTSHWMWFVFPQLAGLGTSEMAQRYAIASMAGARAYLSHPVLGPRLEQVTDTVLAVPDVSAEQLFGGIDARKLQSCMTLFLAAERTQDRFAGVLDRFYGGQPDRRTEELLHRS